MANPVTEWDAQGNPVVSSGAAATEWDADGNPLTPTAGPKSGVWGQIKAGASELWNKVNPVEAYKGLGQSMAHPIDTVTNDINSRQQLWEKGKEAFHSGDYPAALAHAIYANVPFLGPQADEAGTQMSNGEWGKGIGGTVGIGAQVLGPEAAGKVAGLASKAAGPLKEAAVTQYTRALNPTTKANKATAAAVVPKMLDRNIRGGLDSISDQAAAAAERIGKPLDEAIDAIPAEKVQGAAGKVLQSLDELKAKYVVDGKVANPQAAAAISGVQDVVRQFGDDVSPQSLRQLRQIFDDPVAAKAGYAGGDLSTQYALQAQKAAANSLRHILNEASPDVAALNSEMHFWLQVQKVVDDTRLRQTGQQGGLLKTLAPLGTGGAAALGLASHGATTSLEAAAGTAAATAIAQAIRTPAWRTTSAVIKNAVADKLAAGETSQAVALAGQGARAGSALSGRKQAGSQPQIAALRGR